MNKNIDEKVFVLTLGCCKNIVDSEQLIANLELNGFEIAPDINNAKTLIINTCGFIAPAKQEGIEVILEAANLKLNGALEKLIIFGCLSERYSVELKSQIPAVDKFFGVNDTKSIINYLLKSENKDQSEDLIQLKPKTKILSIFEPLKRKIITPNHYAYLKIAEGCSRECSFCAIPTIRGKYASKPKEDIYTEAKQLIDSGVKEIILIAQDTSVYGKDIYSENKISEIAKTIANFDNLEWLRIMYAYPAGFPTDLISTIANEPKICNYIDIPLQHISSRILKSMRRGLDSDKTKKLVYNFRKNIPDVAIRTAFIVGYPGETEHEFQELYDFVEEFEFDRLGVFVYSHEENTHSFKLKDDVPGKEKKARYNALMELQQNISLKQNQNKIGKTLKVLIDEKREDYYFGRTEYDAPEIDNGVLIKSDETLDIGTFIEREVIDAKEYDIYM